MTDLPRPTSRTIVELMLLVKELDALQAPMSDEQRVQLVHQTAFERFSSLARNLAYVALEQNERQRAFPVDIHRSTHDQLPLIGWCSITRRASRKLFRLADGERESAAMPAVEFLVMLNGASGLTPGRREARANLQFGLRVSGERPLYTVYHLVARASERLELIYQTPNLIDVFVEATEMPAERVRRPQQINAAYWNIMHAVLEGSRDEPQSQLNDTRATQPLDLMFQLGAVNDSSADDVELLMQSLGRIFLEATA